MHVLTLLVWVLSLVLLGLAAFLPRPLVPNSLLAAGLFFMDLWIGLQFLLEQTDPITF